MSKSTRARWARPMTVLAGLTISAGAIATLPAEAAAPAHDHASHDHASHDHADIGVESTFTTDGRLTSVVAFDTTTGTRVPVPHDYEAVGPERRATPAEIAAAIEVGERGDAAMKVGASIDGDNSGSGGTPTESGCRTYTVHNEMESVGGFTLWYFDVWNYWCWDRLPSWNITSYNHGWAIHSVDATWSWEGIVSDTHTLYCWRSGDCNSGYKVVKQGHFQQCIWIVCSNHYPQDEIYGHSDGTYYWEDHDN